MTGRRNKTQSCFHAPDKSAVRRSSRNSSLSLRELSENQKSINKTPIKITPVFGKRKLYMDSKIKRSVSEKLLEAVPLKSILRKTDLLTPMPTDISKWSRSKSVDPKEVLTLN